MKIHGIQYSRHSMKQADMANNEEKNKLVETHQEMTDK